MFTKYIICVAGLHNYIKPFVHAFEQPVAKRLPGWGGSKHQSPPPRPAAGSTVVVFFVEWLYLEERHFVV
jgi:hypothetical protein